MAYIYHLEIEAKFCKVNALVNGFPMFEINGNKPAISSKPINVALVGKRNQISFVIVPDNLLQKDKSNFAANVKVKRYTLGDYTGPEKGIILKSASFENVLVGSIEFDNDVFDFSQLFKRNEKITDSKQVIKYGETLKNILASKTHENILKEFGYKIKDYSIAGGEPTGLLSQSFLDYLDNTFYANRPVLDFDEKSITARSWCEDRIWEICVGPEFKEFMSTTPNDDRIQYYIRVFVAKISGELKVVR